MLRNKRDRILGLLVVGLVLFSVAFLVLFQLGTLDVDEWKPTVKPRGVPAALTRPEPVTPHYGTARGEPGAATCLIHAVDEAGVPVEGVETFAKRLEG